MPRIADAMRQEVTLDEVPTQERQSSEEDVQWQQSREEKAMATIRRREQTVAEMEWKLVDEGWSTRVERQTTADDVKNVEADDLSGWDQSSSPRTETRHDL